MDTTLCGLDPVQLLLQQDLERLVSAGKEHDIVCGDDFAASMFGKDLEIASGIGWSVTSKQGLLWGNGG